MEVDKFEVVRKVFVAKGRLGEVKLDLAAKAYGAVTENLLGSRYTPPPASIHARKVPYYCTKTSPPVIGRLHDSQAVYTIAKRIVIYHSMIYHYQTGEAVTSSSKLANEHTLILRLDHKDPGSAFHTARALGFSIAA